MVCDAIHAYETQSLYEGSFSVLRQTLWGTHDLLESDGSIHHRKVSLSMMEVITLDPSQDVMLSVVETPLCRARQARALFLCPVKPSDQLLMIRHTSPGAIIDTLALIKYTSFILFFGVSE